VNINNPCPVLRRAKLCLAASPVVGGGIPRRNGRKELVSRWALMCTGVLLLLGRTLLALFGDWQNKQAPRYGAPPGSSPPGTVRARLGGSLGALPFVASCCSTVPLSLASSGAVPPRPHVPVPPRGWPSAHPPPPTPPARGGRRQLAAEIWGAETGRPRPPLAGFGGRYGGGGRFSPNAIRRQGSLPPPKAVSGRFNRDRDQLLQYASPFSPVLTFLFLRSLPYDDHRYTNYTTPPLP